jgi:hypothetical protein
MTTFVLESPASAPFVELRPGSRIEGFVVRLPQPGVGARDRLFLKTQAGLRAIPATRRRGHSLLESLLSERHVCVDDYVWIRYAGKKRTLDSLREYRSYSLEVCRAR